MDVGRVGAVAGQHARAAARAPDELAVGNLLIADGDSLVFRIDGLHPVAEQHVDLALFPEGGGADEDAVEDLVAGEIFLRQWRAFIGWVFFVTDHGDGPFKAELTKRNGSLRACMARAYDQNVIMAHRPASPQSKLLPSLARFPRTDKG